MHPHLTSRSATFSQAGPPEGPAPSRDSSNPQEIANTSQTTDTSLVARHRRITHLNQKMLRCLYAREAIEDRSLLEHMLRRHTEFKTIPELIQLSDRDIGTVVQGMPRQQRRMGFQLPRPLQIRLLKDVTLAKQLIINWPWLFAYLPAELKTVDTMTTLMGRMTPTHKEYLLRYMDEDSPQLCRALESTEQRIKRDPEALHTLDAASITPRIRQVAVSTNASLLPLFESIDEQEYQTLCELALDKTGLALGFMKMDCRTEARTDRALAHRQPPAISAIPEAIRTPERLTKSLEKTCRAQFLFGQRQRWAFFEAHPPLMNILKKQDDWLNKIPYSERSEALCCEYMVRFPQGLKYVPSAIRNRHPEWLTAPWRPDIYQSLDKQFQIPVPSLLDESQLRALVNSCSILLAQVPKHLRRHMPAWALALSPLAEQQTYLSARHQSLVLSNGGTEGLATAFEAPPFWIDPAALLDPMQTAHCSRRAAWLPDQVRKKLLFCHHFQPRHQHAGWELRRHMDEHTQMLKEQLLNQEVPLWTPGADAAWQHRGGRTLVQEEGGRCVHMKFQRRREPLATFAAEQAVQNFARKLSQFTWKSEIPIPEGFHLVPLEALPVPATAFPDALEVHCYSGQRHALAFRFTTRDSRYDGLAWQLDEQGSSDQAEQGLLNAFHDLGLWSSLGAVHTSTIGLYHGIDENGERPELLLLGLFHSNACYPGALRFWSTKATEASDWGWSGLRDLGDLELYPFITSYVESADVQWTLPGYGQRASFVNALAQNIMAGVLHYARLHRAQASYHYSNTTQVAKLACFLEKGCDALLAGLLGTGSRLQQLFEESCKGAGEIYPQWLRRTAEEIIYWTAAQHPDKDCLARHLVEQGRPSETLYPDHPYWSRRYNEHFVSEEGEHLGANTNKLPLFYLIRGLYLLVAGVADRLSPAEHPDTTQKAVVPA
ncbi:MAG: hypothetical protein OXC07_05490 [Kistimonas sp.]|nr:hypothetical protein [Kistimonas sp.]